MGRFINADGIIGANEDILGYNLYAYVSNNPVNFSDPTGQSVWSWAKNKILKPMASGILQSFVDAGKPFGADFVAEAGHGTGYKGKLNMFGITVIDLGTSKDKSYSYNVTKKTTTKSVTESGDFAIAGFGIYKEFTVPLDKAKLCNESLKFCRFATPENGFIYPFGKLSTDGDHFIGFELDLHFIAGGHIKVGWDTKNVFGGKR